MIDGRILVMIGIWLAFGALYIWFMRKATKRDRRDEVK